MKIRIQLSRPIGIFQIMIDSVLLRNCQSIIPVFRHLTTQLRDLALLDSLRMEEMGLKNISFMIGMTDGKKQYRYFCLL